MNLLTSLWHKQKPVQNPDELLNSALDFALDFNNWLDPIQGRLKEHHPSLSQAELDALNQTCADIIVYGQELALGMSSEVERTSVQARFNAQFSEKYPWVNETNLERAYRHCIYYATKTVRFR